MKQIFLKTKNTLKKTGGPFAEDTIIEITLFPSKISQSEANIMANTDYYKEFCR